MSENTDRNLIEVKDLRVYFPVHVGVLKRKIGDIKAVDGVSFHIRKGETLGLVGESGCGKTTAGFAILRLVELTGGQILFKGEDISAYDGPRMRVLRRGMQIIYQDPFSSLNPRLTVRDIVGEPIAVHNMSANRQDYKDQVAELLKLVGLSPAMSSRYPHEFSGGQRQRIGIARALAVRPSLIVCDEAVSALDVSIQAQIINLLEELQEKFALTYLFIAHDLAVVRHISNRIAVMYLGSIVEVADRLELYRNPRHPYTRALLSAVPIPNPALEAKREHILLEGEVPSPFNPPQGCKFHPRCPEVQPICSQQVPVFRDLESKNHWAACHFA
ncbi:MAG: ATP-binding cassette domain-containing protein [Desulfobacteraceae bacterium]|nr:MAG: ATP-binding cassette domain-containing protein [Desulfobacteraceae bacterium]